MPSSRDLLLCASFALAAAGCATLDAYSLGRADRVEDPPFAVDYRADPAAVDPGSVLIAPVVLENARNRDDWPAGRAEAVAPLIAAMNAYLDRNPCCLRLPSGGLPLEGAPYLYLGSAESELTPEPARIERRFGAEYPAMVLYVEKPSAAWRAAAAAAAAQSGAKHVLWLEAAFAEYPKADRGSFGKQVVLGTRYSRPLEFLTAVDKPVEVMQIVGVLLDVQGSPLRAGGEGYYASDTPFGYQVFDVARTIDHGQIEHVTRSERRKELRGEPLAWEVALDNLVASLLDVYLR